ncbi:MAG: hypothetical protein Q4Q06_04735 [Bacteroidota bacterium]|nr:hypothetical protein [Bacteroidota bacterium]
MDIQTSNWIFFFAIVIVFFIAFLLPDKQKDSDKEKKNKHKRKGKKLKMKLFGGIMMWK